MEKEISDVKSFIFGGKALFTIQNQETNNRFTFRVKKLKDELKNIYFVNVLRGPDNTNDYSYIGAIIDGSFKHTPKSQVNESAQSFKVFDWMIKKINNGGLPDKVKVYHHGRCCRCGRLLTVPESVINGIGPECIKFV
jgi:hypothetical protein